MSFKRVSHEEWSALMERLGRDEARIQELERQLDVRPSGAGGSGGAGSSGSGEGTEPPPTMDERVDALEDEEEREDREDREEEEYLKHGQSDRVVTERPEYKSGQDAPMPAPTPPEVEGVELEELPPAASLPRDGRAPAPEYPAMGDNPGGQPGFKLATAGNEFKWIGGDGGRVIQGDYRSIVGGKQDSFVSGSRTTQIVGPVKSTYSSGTETHIYGNMVQRYNGDSNRIVNGNETRVLNGTRSFEIQGDRSDYLFGQRQDTTIVGRNETVVGYKTEEVFGGKGEVVGPFKNTHVLGMKTDSVDGIKLDIGKALEEKKFPSAKYNMGGLLRVTAGKISEKCSNMIFEAPDFELDCTEAEIIGDLENRGSVKITDDLKTEGKINLGNGDVTN